MLTQPANLCDPQLPLPLQSGTPAERGSDTATKGHLRLCILNVQNKMDEVGHSGGSVFLQVKECHVVLVNKCNKCLVGTESY